MSEFAAALVQRGLPKHVADAFAANAQDESGMRSDINEIKPIVPGARGGYGLMQWTGPRRKQLEAFAAQRGVPVSDMDAQVDFLMHELSGTEKRAASRIFATDNAADAAVSVMNDFLRPHKSHRPKREARYRQMFGGSGSDTLAGGSGEDTLGAALQSGQISQDDLLQEAMRRGLIDKGALEAEAERRGLLGSTQAERIAAEGPNPRDRERVEAALAQMSEDEPETAWDAFMNGVRSVQKVTGGFNDRAMDTLSLGGIGDEFEAFMKATFQGEDGKTWKQEFDEFRDQRRARDSEFEDENGNLAVAADVTGALAGPAQLLGKGINLGKGLAARSGAAAIEGAGMGAVAGFNQGEGSVKDRLENAGGAAATGGLTAGAIPLAAPIVKPVAEVGGRLARGVGNMLGVGSPERRAARLITEAMDGPISPSMAGKPDTLLDVGGENVRRLAQTAHSVPTKNGAAMGEFLEKRVETQGNRIAGDAAEYLGQSGAKYFQTVKEVIRKRSQQVGPIYQRLNKMSTKADGRLAELMERPAMQKALKSASQSIENGTGQIVDLAGERVPFSVLNQAKKEIDQMIRWGKTPEGAAKGADVANLKQLQSALLKEMDDRFPRYATARKVYSDSASIEDAMAEGRKFMKGDTDEYFEAFESLSKAEQEAFRLGIGRELQEIVAKTADNADAARALIKSEFVRDRLQAVTRGHGEFSKFLGNIQRESGYAQVRNDVLKGSQTQSRQTAADTVLNSVEAVGTGGVSNVLSVVKNALIARGKGLNKPTADKIAELLTSEDVPGVMAFLKSKQGRKFISAALPKLDEPSRRILLRATSATASSQVTPAR